MQNFVVQIISAEQTRPLRQLILRPGQPAANSIYSSDSAANAFHLGAVVGTEIVGVASFYNESPTAEDNSESWRLRGMAVSSKMQGRGCGTELLNSGIELIRKRGGKKLWFNARVTAVGFYERLGFAPSGEYFEADGYQHVVMSKQVAAI